MSGLGLVGISISDPGEDELAARGLSVDHVRHAFVEVARQVFAAGGSLAYGGDLRQGGYLQTLLALLRTYSAEDRPYRDRIRPYLAWPVHSVLGAGDETELSVVSTPRKVARADPGASDDRAARARDFTAMRLELARDVEAQVVLGGRLTGQSGRWPGVVEEAYLTLAARKPIFVAGGFGGAAARVADALRGTWPEELTTTYQRTHTAGYEELLDGNVGPRDEDLRHGLVLANSHNGLSGDEHVQLLETVDLDLMVALIMRGLRSTSDGH